MKKLYLYQALETPAGCIGKLLVEGEEFFTLETQNCLKEGEYKLIHTINGFRIDDDYRICMDANGKYRSDGLVIGMSISPRAFDMHRKGDAIQRLFELLGKEECLLIVRNASKFYVADADVDADAETKTDAEKKVEKVETPVETKVETKAEKADGCKHSSKSD